MPRRPSLTYQSSLLPRPAQAIYDHRRASPARQVKGGAHTLQHASTQISSPDVLHTEAMVCDVVVCVDEGEVHHPGSTPCKRTQGAAGHRGDQSQCAAQCMFRTHGCGQARHLGCPNHARSFWCAGDEGSVVCGLDRGMHAVHSQTHGGARPGQLGMNRADSPTRIWIQLENLGASATGDLLIQVPRDHGAAETGPERAHRDHGKTMAMVRAGRWGGGSSFVGWRQDGGDLLIRSAEPPLHIAWEAGGGGTAWRGQRRLTQARPGLTAAASRARSVAAPLCCRPGPAIGTDPRGQCTPCHPAL